MIADMVKNDIMIKTSVKVKYEKPKGQRINHFYRDCIELVGDNKKRPWLLKFEGFETQDGVDVFVDRDVEEEKLKNGEMCHTVASYQGHGSTRLRAFSVKAAKRKVAQIGWMFPNNTTFRDFAGYIGYGVDFVIKNPLYI